MKIALEMYPEAYWTAQSIHERYALFFPLNVSRLLDCMSSYKIHDLSSWTFNTTCAQSETEMLYPKRAWTIYNENLDTYLVVWNKNMDRSSIRFSVAHELGHILLNHERGWLTDRTLKKQYKESEASAFARYLLAPFGAIQCLLHTKPFNARLVSKYFGLPYASARELRYDYEYWLLAKNGMPHENRPTYYNNT